MFIVLLAVVGVPSLMDALDKKVFLRLRSHLHKLTTLTYHNLPSASPATLIDLDHTLKPSLTGSRHSMLVRAQIWRTVFCVFLGAPVGYWFEAFVYLFGGKTSRFTIARAMSLKQDSKASKLLVQTLYGKLVADLGLSFYGISCVLMAQAHPMSRALLGEFTLFTSARGLSLRGQEVLGRLGLLVPRTTFRRDREDALDNETKHTRYRKHTCCSWLHSNDEMRESGHKQQFCSNVDLKNKSKKILIFF